MNKELKAEIKKQLPNYLEGKGIDLSKNFHCLNPSHPDKNPSMGYFKEGQIVKCFSCDAQYDVLDLIGLDYGLNDYADKLEKAKELFHLTGSPVKAKAVKTTVEKKPLKKEDESDFTSFYEEAKKNLSQTDYYKKRGLTEETAKRFGLGYVHDWQHPKTVKQGYNFSSPRLIIPLSPQSYLARDTRDDIEDKSKPYVKQVVGKKEIFNLEALKGSKPVFIVEGELDAMSIYEVGGEAVALGSISMINRLVENVKEIKPEAPLIIALDNDEAGEKSAKELEAKLKDIEQEALSVNLYGSYKDANEALIKNKSLLKANVKKWQSPEDTAKKEYLKNSAEYLLDGFLDEISNSINTPCISTGFSRLDELLDGGLYEGLYIMGAVSSLGKTTLALQIADQIAMQGHDALIFSLEMARYELMAKSISRHTMIAADKPENKGKYQTHDPKTVRGITEGKRHLEYRPLEREIINEAIEDYKTYASNVFILEGEGDIGVTHIRENVERHIKVRGKKPVVFIDYLQILAPNDVRASDKQNTDKAVLELKRISRDFKIPVIGISSFNRQNYNAKVNMAAFKESGAVEYSSDVLIGLQASGLDGLGSDDIEDQINEVKRNNERDIELVILKNRHGRANAKVAFNYYALFNRFLEETTKNEVYKREEGEKHK